MTQLQLFKDNLPYKPYCSDTLRYGVKIRDAQTAIKSRYIQHNQPTKKYWLVFDIDRAGAAYDWIERDLAAPNLIVENPENKHAHLFYSLELPVVTSDNGRIKPLRYAGAVEHAYAKKLEADLSYSGLICKNPLHKHWNVETRNQYSYDLEELSEYVNLEPYQDKRKRLPDYGLGRNCNLFDKTRLWAYSAVKKHSFPEISVWNNLVLERAAAFNMDFITPLPEPEVRAVAKSISKWTYQRFNHLTFDEYVKKTHTSEIQRLRGKNGGVKSGVSRKKQQQGKKQLLLDVIKILPEKSVRELSELTSIPKSTVNRILKDIDRNAPELCINKKCPTKPISDNSSS